MLIWIPKSSEADHPHLLTHIVVDEDDRKITTKYGLAIRTGARNSLYAVANIHALIQSGLGVSKVERSLSSIETKLASLLQAGDDRKGRARSISLAHNRKTFVERIPEFLTMFGRGSDPTLVLGAFPSEEIVMNEIYDGASSVARAFDNPLSLRDSGFGLNTGRQVDLVGGVARVAINNLQKGRHLSNSGNCWWVFPQMKTFSGGRRTESRVTRYATEHLFSRKSHISLRHMSGAYLTALLKNPRI